MNFAVWLRIPRKNWFLEEKMKSVSERKQSTPKIVPSFGPHEKPQTVKNVFIHFVCSHTANVLFIERKILARQGSK